MFKKKKVTIDLEQEFLNIWENDKQSLLYRLERFPLKFFTDRELSITEKEVRLERNFVTYYRKTPIITFKDRIFKVSLIYDYEGVISDEMYVKEVPISKII